MKTYKIYTLSDPFTKEVKYIGCTTQKLILRWYHHCSKFNLNNQNSKKTNWIIHLKSKGYKPLIDVIDEVTVNWQFWEKYWICQFKQWGFDLVNMTEGGYGSKGYKKIGKPHTDATKLKISIANSRPKSKQWIKNARDCKIKKNPTPVVQYDLSMNPVNEFTNLILAAESIDVRTKTTKMKNIHACCNYKRKTAYGYIWKYKMQSQRIKSL